MRLHNDEKSIDDIEGKCHLATEPGQGVEAVCLASHRQAGHESG